MELEGCKRRRGTADNVTRGPLRGGADVVLLKHAM